MEAFFGPMELRMIGSVLALIGIWFIRFIVLRYLNRSANDFERRATWRQIINFLTTGLVAILLVRIWFDWFQSFITLLSVIAAALTIVSKEIILNIAAYGIIVWRGLFKIGDRVQIAGTTGDVLQNGLMYIWMAETFSEEAGDGSSGRFVKIPNKEVLEKHVFNFSRGRNLLWREVDVFVPLTADVLKATRLLQGILEEISCPVTEETISKARDRNEELIFMSTDPQVFLKVNDSKAILTCRYLCHINDVRGSQDRLWRVVLERLPKEGVYLSGMTSPEEKK